MNCIFAYIQTSRERRMSKISSQRKFERKRNRKREEALHPVSNHDFDICFSFSKSTEKRNAIRRTRGNGSIYTRNESRRTICVVYLFRRTCLHSSSSVCKKPLYKTDYTLFALVFSGVLKEFGKYVI